MDVSVVLCTYNRGELLTNALQSLHEQKTNGISFEILIVDNNSTDHTRELVQRFVENDSHFRYLFERKQGLSHARNAGIAAAESDLIVFTDDDIEFEDTWIQQNFEAGQRFPDADYLGGKVLPVWQEAAPDWVKYSMSPLAVQDWGSQPVTMSPAHPRCLVGASLAVRRRAFDKTGLFSIDTQRVKDGIGSTEDFDWEKKVWEHGGHGVWVPEIVCRSPIQPDRGQKAYHRRWHCGHGKFQAISCNSEHEGPRRVLGVPLFVYRQMVQAAVKTVTSRLTGKHHAFAHETQLWFFAGFIREKWKSRRVPEQHAAANLSVSRNS